MFFQISPSRPDVKSKPVPKENESEKLEVLSLAPFTPNPKLFFEDVPVGVSTNRKLLIENPTNNDIHLFLTNNIPQELNVTLIPEEIVVNRKSNAILELIWQPLHEEFSRYTISLGDGKRIHRDVPVAFKSVLPKKAKNGSKQKRKPLSTLSKEKVSPKNKSPTKKYYSAKPPYRSPKKYSPSPKKYSPVKKYTPPKARSPLKKCSIKIENASPDVVKQTIYTTADYAKKRYVSYKVKDKENVPSLLNISSDSNIFVSPGSATFRLDYLQPVERRETYVVNGKKEASFSESVFNDSLENMSPDVSPRLTNKRQPLGISNQDNISPRNTELCNYNFEYKLRMESFTFSPISAPLANTNFSPGLSSSIDTNSFKKTTTEVINTTQVFSTENKTFELPKSPNISTETYVKSNLSTETYVKGNASFETYVKSNLSGGTFTKDTSVGDIANLSVSPISRFTISPKTCKTSSESSQSSNSNADGVRQIIEANLWSGFRNQPLSSIKEESYINQSLLPEAELNSSNKSFLKRKSDLNFTFTPPKRPYERRSPKDWSKSSGTPIRIVKRSSGLNLKKFLNNSEAGNCSVTTKDTHQVIIKNPFLLAATNLADPFMTPHLFIDEEWLDQQQVDFKKWLNALLTPPEELNSDETVVDVAKVWQDCKKREVDAAPTKETISSKYLVNSKLNSLRKSAQNLYRSKEMSCVLSKVVLAVETGKLAIRDDKDVHLNLALKSEVMAMLLSYNPLWLRIGLETIYNEIIPLKSNSDVVGLSTFIANRVLKDPYLIKKYKLVQSPKYIGEFKKFFLKKFLVLVYFLDQAKNKKLIPHDPCLFCKNSSIKESKEMLIKLARELLAAIGNITKYLKYTGYVVSHVQTYIHEFDYAVKNLGVDLRDGVRLTKVMEIISMEENLTANLRVPAISRLQKIHNMNIVFNSLEKAGYKILYDISPKDIVNGHKEKTLSFLWQIVYKFQAPLMVKSATTIQNWFRSLPVVLKRRRLERIRLRRHAAATKIQMWYKRQKLIQKLEFFKSLVDKYLVFIRKERAAIKIQSYYKMYRCHKLYRAQRSTILNIQRFARGWIVRNIRKYQIRKVIVIQSYVRMYLARKQYLLLRNAARTIQTRYRAKKMMEIARTAYIRKISAVLVIQRWIRRITLLKQDKFAYTQLKTVVSCIQNRFRANRLCRIERQRYLEIKCATIRIQTWYRSVTTMKLCRERYLKLKNSVIIVEQRYIAFRSMQIERREYQDLRKACVIIQRRYKAQREMKIQRRSYSELKAAAVTIQNRYRTNQLCKRERQRYETLKSSTLFIQRRFRANVAMRIECKTYNRIREAAIKIQVWFRATLEMRKCLTYYVSLKYAVHIFEDRYRAKKLMEKESKYYKQLKIASITVQRRYRALVLMRESRDKYLRLKAATIFIQRRFRANKMAQLQRMDYVKLKKAAVIMQRRYRAQIKMKEQRNEFLKLRKAATIVQQRYRAKCFMKTARSHYLNLLKYTLILQQHFRANKRMLIQRQNYTRLRNAAVFIQQKWRAKKVGNAQKQKFEELKKAALTVQRRWRANKACHQEKTKYMNLRKSVANVQCKWRAKKLCEKERSNYIQLRNATITCQRIWRAKYLKEIYHKKYSELKTATVFIQRRWRSQKSTKKQREEYVNLRKSVINIQSRWRANKLAQKDRNDYLVLKNAAVTIRLKWRAEKLSRQLKSRYIELKNAAIFVQRRWRLNKLARDQRVKYESFKMAVINTQRRWRSNQLAKREKYNYTQLRSAAIFIQHKWRAKVAGKHCKQDYETLRRITINVQSRWRATKLGRKERESYETLRYHVVRIQILWRANRLTRIEREKYARLKSAAVFVQNRWRAQKLGEHQKIQFELLKKTTVFVQRRWRASVLSKKERTRYLELKHAAITIQSHWRRQQARRKYLQMKKAAITLQQRWTAKKLRDHHQKYYESLRKVTVFTQRKWRSNKLARAAIQNYQALKNATVILQNHWRAKKQAEIDRNNYMVLKKSAVILQQRWRARKIGRHDKQEYDILKETVIIIQRKWRANKMGLEARNNFMILRQATVIIQQRWRAQLLKRVAVQRYALLRSCCIKIQIWFRATLLMRRQRDWFVRTRRSAIVIQRYYRNYISMKQLRSDFCNKRRTVLTLQKYIRGYLVRRKYANYFTQEERERRRVERRQSMAATKIQALWRGHKSRSVDSDTMVEIRQRAQTATLNAVPQNTLGCRCRVALQALVCKNTISDYCKVLKDLDYITRHSRDVCATIARFLPEQMYLMIKTSNRSLPEMWACIYSVNILINVCKYKLVAHYSYFPEYIDGIVTAMMHWCDKESQLFPSMCTLLWLFAHTPEWRAFIVSLPNIQHKFLKIQSQISRKQTMVRKAGIKGHSVFAPYTSLPLPSVNADWGLDYKHSPYAFTNSIHAFSSLLRILDL